MITPPISQSAAGRRAATTDSATEAPIMPTPKVAATRPYSVDVPCSGPFTRKTRATLSMPANVTKTNVPTARRRTVALPRA